jgi:hypothetical protein
MFTLRYFLLLKLRLKLLRLAQARACTLLTGMGVSFEKAENRKGINIGNNE